MLKELLEKVQVDDFGEGKVVATFDDVVEYLKDKFKLKIVYQAKGDSYVTFQKNGKEFSLTQSWEGGQYVLKILDEEGLLYAQAKQKYFMTNDGWYKIEFITDWVKDALKEL